MANIKLEKKMIRQIAKFYVKNKSTVRKTAEHFGISKTCVHNVLSYIVSNPFIVSSILAIRVEAQIKKNLKERSLRGGEATKQKFKNNVTK